MTPTKRGAAVSRLRILAAAARERTRNGSSLDRDRATQYCPWCFERVWATTPEPPDPDTHPDRYSAYLREVDHRLDDAVTDHVRHECRLAGVFEEARR
jgi:hypothetical protein